MAQLIISSIPAVYALLYVIPVWLAARFIVYLIDRRPRDSVRCRRCWYDLRGNASGICSECGAEIQTLGAWWPGHPNQRRWVNCLGVWFAICAIPTAYLGLIYERATTGVTGFADIRAMVDKQSNSGVMLFVDSRSIKLPLIPMRDLWVEEVCYNIKNRESDYGLFAHNAPLVVYFDTPATMKTGMPIKPDMLEVAAKQVFADSLPAEFNDAIAFISTVSERLISEGRINPDRIEDISNALFLEMGSPPSFVLEINGHTSFRGGGLMPRWIRWVLAIPMFIVWAVGAVLITSRMRHRGIVWSIQSDKSYD